MADDEYNYGGVEFPKLPDQQAQDEQPPVPGDQDFIGPVKPPDAPPPTWQPPWDYGPGAGEPGNGGAGEPPVPGDPEFTGPVDPRSQWRTPWQYGPGAPPSAGEPGSGGAPTPPEPAAPVPGDQDFIGPTRPTFARAPWEYGAPEPQIQTAPPGGIGLVPSAGGWSSPLAGAQALYNVGQGAAAAGVTPPDLWNAAKQGIGQIGAPIIGLVNQGLNLFDKPTQDFTRPVIARNWLQIGQPGAADERPLFWDKNPQPGQGIIRTEEFAAAGRQIGDWLKGNPLGDYGEYVRQTGGPPITMSGLPVVPNLDAWRGMYRWNLGAWKALVGPLYGNAEEIATYQERAPWYYQLASEGLADPLNMVDPFSDAAIDSIRVARAMAKVTPTAKTVAEISAGMMREGQQASSVLAKVNPFRHTNDALQHELVQDAAEALTRIANAAPAGEGAQWVSMLARSPDTLADATGGYAASPQAKRASALLQRLLTPEGGTVPEYRTLEKIVAEAKGDEIAAVSSLAAKLQGAAESFFPSAPRGTLKAGRDWVNNLLSTVYMGYSPGYAVRNASNNVVTALLDGVSPFEDSGRLREFWTRWGPPPLQAKQGIGVAGSVWSSKDESLKYLSTLTEPVRARDVAKSFLTLKQPTTQGAQMVEQYFSERITYNAIRKYWGQTWTTALREAERELTGLPPEARELVIRRLRGVMSADEARAVVREIAGQGGDLGRSMPWSVAKALEDAGGHDLADVVREVTHATGSPAAVEPILRHTEQTAEIVAGIRAMGGGSFEKDVNGLLGFMDRIDTFIAQAIDANDAAIDQLWQETAKLPRETRSRLWQTHWQTFLKNMEQVHAEVDALQEATLPRFNFQGSDISRFQGSRQQTLKAWQEYVARLRATWDASDKMMALDQPVGELWKEFKAWRAEHWQRYRAARYQRIEEEAQAIRRALVRTGANDLTSGAHAQAVLDAWRQQFPEAFQVWAALERAKKAGGKLDGPSIGIDFETMRRARQAGFVIGTGKGTRVTPTWLKANQIVEQMYEMAGSRSPVVQYVAPRVRAEMPETTGAWAGEQPKALPAPRYPAYEKPGIVREGPLGKRPPAGGAPIPLYPGGDTLRDALTKRGIPEYLVMRADEAALTQAEQLARTQQGLLKRYWSWSDANESMRQQVAEILNGGPITIRPQAADWTQLTGETPRFTPPSDYVSPRVSREYPQPLLGGGGAEELGGRGAGPMPPEAALPPSAGALDAGKAQVAPVAATRPVYTRDITFEQWLDQKGIARTEVLNNFERGDYIGQTAFPQPRTAAEKGKQNTLAKRYQRTMDLEKQYADEVPTSVVSERPIDPGREDDAAYLRVQEKRAARVAEARGEAIVPVSPQVARGPVAYGRETTAAGINDPNQQYAMRYKVMSLDDLTASHLDSLEPNSLFPAELQPRLRDRVGSQEQIGKIARTLNPDALLEDTKSLDRGPMIVGRDNAVESGNGRTLALRKAKAENPLNWLAYQEGLREIAPSYGISVAELEGIPNPVLVRERIGPVDRVAFSAEANASNVLAMSPYETALQDAKRLTDSMVAGLDVGAEQSVEQALRSAGNRPLVRAFMETLPANERAALLDASGALNPAGLQRLKAAVFAKTYGGEAGRRLTQTFTESLDPGIKQIEAGMFGSLPAMGRAESQIRLGERDAGLSLADDMAAAVDMLARLKQEGMRIEDFLAQGALFERELTPFQEELLGWLNANSRSPNRIRELLAEYADGVIGAPTTSQMGLFGDVDRPTKEGIYERVRQATATADARADAGTLFAGATQSATFGAAGPRLEGASGAKGAGAGVGGQGSGIRGQGAAAASPAAAGKVEAGAATYGQDARADFAKYKQLRSEFMAEADSQRIDELKAEMTRLAQAWERNDPFSDYFTEFLENKALRPGDSPSGMNFTYGKSTFKKREGQWIYSKGVHEGQPVTNREIISNLERGLSDYRKEIDAAKAGALAPAPKQPAPKGAPAGGKPIKAKDIPFGAPAVGGDRLAKLKQMAMESEERTGSQFWSRVPFTENPYYDPASRRLRMAIDSEGIVADLEAAGYHNIEEWWAAEIAPVKFPKYVSKYVLDAEGLTDVKAGPPAGGALSLLEETGSASLAPMYDVADAARHAATKTREVLTDWLKWHNTSQPVGPLTPEQAAHLWEWTNKRAIPEMIQAKAITGDLASQTRDFALLDYADRRNLDSWLSWVFPYSYWYTRTFNNFAQRIAANPALVSNYARITDQIKRANQGYYRQQTGDPNAQMPEYWERQVRVPWFGNDLYFNLDAALNPLNSLVSDFKTRTRGEAPGGEFVQQVGSYGPTIWAPWIWGYAGWLWQNGYKDAAQEWVGYIMPQSRAIKGLSALAREPGTALNRGIQALGATQSQIEGVIPPGGTAPEIMAGLPTVQGGDIWERKRVGYFLYRLLDEGMIDESTFRDTAFSQSGPVWDRARQMEAVERAPGSLMSWGLGSGFKRRTQADIDVARMWEENSAVWDKQPDDPNSVEYGLWRRELDAFNNKYPWAKGVMLAGKLDPVKRLEAFTSMVLNALPPGKERYNVMDEIGATDIVNQFYASKRKIAGWGAAEIAGLKDAVTKLAARYGAPTPEDRQVWEQAKQIHEWQRNHALAQVNALSGPATWSALTLEDLNLIQDRYFQIPETNKVERRAYLDQHPALSAFWDATHAATAMSVPGDGVAGAPQMRRGLTAQQAQGITAPFWPPSPTNETRAGLVAAKGEAWVKQAETLEKAYLNAGPSGSRERSAWGVAHKSEYGTLKVLWELRDGLKAAEGQGGKGAGGPMPTGTLGLANWKPELQVTSIANGRLPAATEVSATGARATLPGYSAAEAVKRFGQDIFGIESEYLDLDTDGRKAWRAANAQEYAQLAQYWDFKYGPSDGTAGGNLAPGYSDGEAIKRFGADILGLEAEYSALDTAGRTAWRTANAAAYARLKTFWDFKYGPQTSTGSSSSGGYGGGVGGSPVYGGGGRGGGGGGGRAPAPAPIPAVPPAPAPDPGWMTPEEQARLEAEARQQEPAFEPLAKLMWGGDILSVASAWSGMDGTARAAWAKANPAAYARLLRYLLWLRSGLKPGAYTRTVASRPANAPIVPPVVTPPPVPAATAPPVVPPA